jgi:TetR/AcrR family transcriptional repressor of nem operon
VTERAYTDGLRGVIDDIAERLTADDPRSVRGEALSVSALMVGTLEVSRAMADRRLADEISSMHPDRPRPPRQ